MKWLRIALQALAVVGFLLLLAFGPMFWGRNYPMPAERAEALRVLAAPVAPVAGRDASDAAWLLQHDVPLAERARVAAQARAYLEARQDRLDVGDERGAAALVDPRDRFAKFPGFDKARGLCNEMTDPCLPRVRAGGAATTASLHVHAGALKASVEMGRFDGLRYGLAPRADQSSPPLFDGHRLVLTALAARFAAGESEAAIAHTCADLAGWRRLGSDTDVVVGSAIATAYVMQDLRLLSEMLAERPAGKPLPPGCAVALAATTPAELDICTVVRYEFRDLPAQLRQSLRDISRTGGLWSRAGLYLWDPQHTVELSAPKFARFCSAGLRAHLVAGRRASEYPHPQPRCSDRERIGHPVGCQPKMEELIDLGYYDDYLDRRSDQAEAIALMRTWLWLRERSTDAAQWPKLLRQRPATLGLHREVDIDAEQRLSIPRFHTRRDARFDLRTRPAPPLPPGP